MKIILTNEVALKVLACAHAAGQMEFSGFGFVRITANKDFEVYDFVPLDVGSYGWTEFGGKAILPLLDREDARNLKCWTHAHPVGNGVPGPHNWSGTDHNTCLNEPLGSTPQLVKWSISIVLTPGGWVGRYDNYVKKTTQHLEVEPNIARFHQEMAAIAAGKLDEKRQTLAGICMAMEEVINTVDLDTLAELQLSEKELWEMLSKKVNWAGNAPVSYEDWYFNGEDAFVDEAEAARKGSGGWKQTAAGIHGLTDQEIAKL